MHVFATAGHVDHGKSTLVRALTGMEPDRWSEEKRRGMTIDLGYAWMTLPGGEPIAFVDVPGHRRFISNMLAGVGPVPAVMLVVAADEGWCQQTGEHVQALDALGVEHGLLVLSRADLGDVELAESEARDHLAGTSLAALESVGVSAVTGEGMAELRTALARVADRLPEPPPVPTRLWVDRSFTVRGSGTVVTGTLPTGAVAVGDTLEVVPSGRHVTVRGIQTLKASVESAPAVARVALNLRGVAPEDVPRGAALVATGRWHSTAELDVRLRSDAEQLPREPLLHIGSAAVAARLRRLGPHTARLTLTHELPLRVGDRALLRDPGQVGHLTGVELVDVFPPPLGRRGAGRRRAAELDRLLAEPGPGTELAVRGAVRRTDLVRAGLLGPAEETPPQAVTAGDWLVTSERWGHWRAELGAAVQEWAAQHPMRPGLPRAAAVRRLALPEAALLDQLLATLPQLRSDADGVHHRDHAPALPAAVEQALAGLQERLDAAPFDSPELPQLEQLGLSEEALQLAARRGQLLRLARGVYLGAGAIDRAVVALGELPQPFTASEARQALGTTRRVALPLLQELDRRRVTRADAEQRRTLVRR
ncbi:selenocysteine-specific translation elongation factor [Nocardioides sp. BP30]|uniref:selenocysteine-specific translation elongation factor n=1 Tax=Nocardioides sp. BP30 TaxID=3036374 RepID=UPI00246907F2|nr:selenocysteine-specific translation elongation factor [Nocardioides sp. BP30]WGL51412.1 selenocysteine-specific translation elongation factor [Nocardioides sp. BP30]